MSQMPELPPEIEEADAAGAAQVVDAIGAEAPVAAEPFSPDRVVMLQDQLGKTIGVLSGGQVPPLPEMPIEAAEGLTQLPGQLYTGLAAVKEGMGMAAQAGVEGAAEYSDALDLENLAASDEGLQQLHAVLGEISMDQGLVEAMATTQVPGTEEPAPEPVEEPAVDDLDGLL